MIDVWVVLVQEASDVLDREAFVSECWAKDVSTGVIVWSTLLNSTCFVEVHLLRDVYSSDHCGSQHPFPAHHQVLQEVDGDVVVGRQEDANVAGQEVVYFPLAAVLRCELLRGDVGLGWSAHLHLDLVLIDAVHIKLFGNLAIESFSC